MSVEKCGCVWSGVVVAKKVDAFGANSLRSRLPLSITSVLHFTAYSAASDSESGSLIQPFCELFSGCGWCLGAESFGARRHEATMALPKRKISKARGRKRRTHIRARSIQVVLCKECHLSILPHAVCPRCGHYARFSSPVMPADD